MQLLFKGAPGREARYLAILALALLFGCASEKHAKPDTTRDAGDPDDASSLPDLNAIVCEPNIESIRTNVFGKACAFEACHGNEAAWGLWLEAPDIEAVLVNGRAASCRSWVLVAPASPEQSFLWHKINDDEPPCGERMPFGLGRLPDSVLECVMGWILSLD